MSNPITTPKQAIAFAKDELLVKGDARERCVMISLSGAIPLRTHLVGIGSYSSVLADVRYVAKEALLDNATSVILLHTHPGGCMPSKSDIETTDGIRKGLSCLSITLLDHIIVGRDEFFSFNEERTSPLD